MNITDDMLSAFLDQQLAPKEQATINTRLLIDTELQRRLGQLYAQHMALKWLTREIDQVNPVQDTPLFQLKPKLRQPDVKLVKPHFLSIAASIVFLAGLALAFLSFNNTSTDNWQVTQTYLTNYPSGRYSLADKTLLLQFSFLDKNFRYCRTFDITDDGWLSRHIACKQNEAWQLVLSTGHDIRGSNLYQAASGQSLIDSQLDQLIEGSPFKPSEEQQHIRNGWR